MANSEYTTALDMLDKWSEARALLREFQSKTEALGPGFAALGAVSWTTMDVTAATSAESISPSDAMRFVVAIIEGLRRSYGWGKQETIGAVLGILQTMLMLMETEGGSDTVS